MRDVFPTMQALCTSSTRSKDKQIPFIYCQYNIFYFFSSATTHITNILMKMLNATIEGFNRCDHLPRFIVFMPDEDILLSLNHSTYGISYLLGLCLNWFSKQVERLIETRMEDLHRKKPGSVFGNTHLIWIKMLGRVTTLMKKAKFYSLHQKFNVALDDLEIKRKQTHVMNITSLEPRHYDRFSRLGYAGKNQLWHEIDLQLTV